MRMEIGRLMQWCGIVGVLCSHGGLVVVDKHGQLRHALGSTS